MRIELNADGFQISPHSFAALIKTHEQRAFTAPASALGEQTRQCGLGSAGRAGDQCAAAAEQTATQHLVEPRKPGRHALASCFLRDVGAPGDATAMPCGPKLSGNSPG